jgi:hypothetical protein
MTEFIGRDEFFSELHLERDSFDMHYISAEDRWFVTMALEDPRFQVVFDVASHEEGHELIESILKHVTKLPYVWK